MSTATTKDVPRTGNVSDLLRGAASRHGARPALLAGTVVRSWADLDRAADSGVAALLRTGLRSGDRVIVSLPTSPNIVAALFAIARAGMVAVPLGPMRAELDAVSRTVGARGAIGDQLDVATEGVIRSAELDDWWARSTESTEPIAAVAGGEDIAVLARAAAGDRPVMLSHRAI